MFRILKHNLFDTVVGATVVIDVEVVDVDPHLKRPHQSRRSYTYCRFRDRLDCCDACVSFEHLTIESVINLEI